MYGQLRCRLILDFAKERKHLVPSRLGCGRISGLKDTMFYDILSYDSLDIHCIYV